MVTFNHGKYIAEALDSILMQQTSYSYKIVVAEDCSTDNTREILLDYQKKYPNKFKLILQHQNIGARKNNIDLLNNLDGKYIAALEGDDYWTDPYKLQKQVDFLESNREYGLVYNDVDFLYEKTNSVNQSVFKNNTIKNRLDFYDHLINGYYFAPLTWVFRKELVSHLNNNNIYSDGSFTIMLYFLKFSKVKYLTDTTGVYRVLEESASHSKNIDKVYKRWMGVFRTQVSIARDFNESEYLTNYIKILKYSYALNNFAYILNDTDLIKEAEVYFKSINAYHIFDTCKVNNLYRCEKKRKLYKLYKKADTFLAFLTNRYNKLFHIF